MPRLRAAQALSFLALSAALSCRGGERPAGDSARDTAGAPKAPPEPAPWVSELGSLLVVPSDSDNTGVVLFPATPRSQMISAADLSLLSASGDTAHARAALVASDSQVCGEAPMIHMSPAAETQWTVALQARSVTPFRMDSIEALSPTDSARLAVELARVASSVPDSGGSRFSASPFVVLSARRFDASGRRIVVAHLVRRLPQEALPMEEHTLVIAERADTAEGAPFLPAYHERSEGTEETVDHYEVLAAVRSRESVFLLLSREREAQTVYEILQRTKTGWRTRWSRTLAC